MFFPGNLFFLKNTHRGKAPSNKASALTKILNTDIRVIGAPNQVLIRGSYAETKFLKKIK